MFNLKKLLLQRGNIALNLLIVGALLVAVPVGVVLVQRQTQLQSKAAGGSQDGINWELRPFASGYKLYYSWDFGGADDCTVWVQIGNSADFPSKECRSTSEHAFPSSGAAIGCGDYAVQAQINGRFVSVSVPVHNNTTRSGYCPGEGGGGSNPQPINTPVPTVASCQGRASISYGNNPTQVNTPVDVNVSSSDGADITNVALNSSNLRGGTVNFIRADVNGNNVVWRYRFTPVVSGDYDFNFSSNGRLCTGGPILTVGTTAVSTPTPTPTLVPTATPTPTPSPTPTPIRFTNADINAILTDTRPAEQVIAGRSISAGKYLLQANAIRGINNFGIAVYKTDQTGAQDGISTGAAWGCAGKTVVGVAVLGKEFCYIELIGSPAGFPANATTTSTDFVITQPGTYKVYVDVIQREVNGKQWKCYGSNFVSDDFACANDVNTTMKTLTVVSPRGYLCTERNEMVFRQAWIIELLQRGLDVGDYSTDCDRDGFVEVEDYNIWRDYKIANP